jgi:hypothetical protein
MKTEIKSLKVLFLLTAIIGCCFTLNSFGQAPCNAPSGLSSTGITISAATLSWTAIPGAGHYNVMYQEVGSSSAITVSAATESVTINSLNASSNYEWQVQTDCGSANLSAFSASETFSTPASVCSVPTGLNTTGITLTDATMNWTIVSGAAGYNIQYRIVGAPSWTSSSSWTLSSATTASLTVSSLAPGNYEWQVQTDCGSSNMSAFSSSAGFSTTVALCDIPTGVNASNITTTSATLVWNGMTNATAYNIQYRVTGNSSWSSATSSAKLLALSSLVPSTQYEWQVQTDCGNANVSGFSSLTKFTTSGVPSCNNIPTGLNTVNVTEASAVLHWSAGTNDAELAGFEIQYRAVGNPSWTTITSITSSATVSSLIFGTNYEWQVRSNCSSSLHSSYSALGSFTTMSHAPANTSSTNYPLAVPVPNNPSTWISVIASTGNAQADWQIVHDWLLAHGCILK